MKNKLFSEMGSYESELIKLALKVTVNSYAPASGFAVGAAISTIEKQVMPGCNFENSSYGLTMCAERNALGGAISQGYRLFDKIAITARLIKEDGFQDISEAVAPCGACRQVLNEASHISGRPIEVIMASSDLSKVVIADLSELLTMSFGPLDLGQKYVEFVERYRFKPATFL